MINNFEQIKKLLSFTDSNDFYFIQILQRRKDNNEDRLDKNVRLIKSYYISSIEQLDELSDEIIGLCTYFNARAYINLNKRNYKKNALQTARLILDQIANEDYKSSRRAFNTICGRYSSTSDKKWIVDIDDTKDVSPLILAYINYTCEPICKTLEDSKIYDIIKTRNGLHLITKPFNLKTFNMKYPHISIHKNNPTILYIP